TATHEPSTVEMTTFGFATTACSPWTIEIRSTTARSGKFAEHALYFLLKRGRSERFHEVVVHAQRSSLLHDLTVGRAGEHDEDGLSNDGVLPHLLQELQAVHLRHI